MRLTINFTIFLLFLGLCLNSTTSSLNCTNFWQSYKDKITGIKILDSPSSLVTAVTTSNICRGSSSTCCSVETENELKTLSKIDYENALKNVLTSLGKMLKTKSVKFNDFFKEMLIKSKKDFHDMFKRTYGILYEQNSYIFTDFFGELESYYTHGKSNLADVMDNFFTILYQKMFTVLQRQYKFDEKYLVCISEHMSELKPFGDVPQKLALPLKRSFVATRAYAQSLGKAGDIVLNLIHLPPTEQCINAVMKMLHCPSCAGITNSNVCVDYCINIMKGCAAYHTEMDASWVKFIDAMSDLERRLVGSFNIELVVEPMNVKISEGIMNFQESSEQVSAKLFKGCGTPPLIHRRRKRQSKGYDEDDYGESGSPRGIQFDDSSRPNDYEDDEDDDDGDINDESEDDQQQVAPVDVPVSGNVELSKERIIDNDESSSDVDGNKKNSINKSNPKDDDDDNSNNNDSIGGNGNDSASEINSNGNNNKNKKKIKGNNDFGLEEYGSSSVYGFSKLIKDIGAEITNTKHFWKKLPAQMCSQDVVPVQNNRNASCWNGTAISSYNLSVVSDGKKHQQWNPEVPVDVKKKSSLLNEQIFALKTLTSQLRSAHNGMDVNWIDAEELEENASGSGYSDIATVDEDNVEYGSGDGQISFNNNNNNNENNGLPVIVSNENATIVPVLYTPMPNFVVTVRSDVVNVTRSTDEDMSTKRNRSNTFVRILSNNNNNNNNDDNNANNDNNNRKVFLSFNSSTSTTSSIGTEAGTVVNINDVEGIANVENTVVRNGTNNVGTNSNSAGTVTSVRRFAEISLDRAIASYLLPAVVIWIGGSFNDWFDSLI